MLRFDRTKHMLKKLTLLKKLSDNYLMNQVREGDLTKMGVLYERYHRRVFAYFFRCSANQPMSEDLTHNVFVRLIKYRESFTGSGEFVHWLFTVVRNTWLDQHGKTEKDVLKKSRNLDEVENKVVLDNEEGENEFKENRISCMRKALQMLSPEKREAIMLSRYEGLRYEEIAEISECSISTIKTRVQRGLLDLKNIMLQLETGI